MSWKPIPQEAPSSKRAKKTHIRAAFKKHPIYKQKKFPHSKTPYRLFQSVSIRLLEYVKKEGKYSKNEVADLITDMQRTIVNLQKKRMQLFENEKEKTKRKKKNKAKFKVKRIKK